MILGASPGHRFGYHPPMSRSPKPPVRLLVIEDDIGFAEPFCSAARQHPGIALVSHAADLATAVELATASSFDLAVVDLELTDGSGLDFIRAHGKGLRSVVLTVHEQPASITEALAAGATGYLLKHDVALIERLLTACTGDFPISARMARYLVEHWQPRTATPQQTPSPLSARENEILQTLAQGRTYRETGAELNISEHTVADHIKNIYRKLSVNSRAAAVYRANQNGWLRLPH